MSGNLARRRMVKFMPAEFKLTETRQPPLKDQYDEWLARVICYAFSVPASAFVTQVNRATSETLRAQAATEGLVPLKAWVKMALDRVIGVCFGAPDIEFYWVGDDAVDPLQQAQTIAILVNAGVKTVAEARVELGLGGAAGVVKFNPFHDEQGRFTTAEGAVEPGTHEHPKPSGEGDVTETRRLPTTDANGTPRQQQEAQIDPVPMPEPPPPASGEPPASAPVGRSGSPIEIQRGTNDPGTINGRDYTGHSLDRSQGRGIPPSVVEETISSGQVSPGKEPGSTAYYSTSNNVTVIVDSASGRVTTVRKGKP
jgi:hypothetical protein